MLLALIDAAFVSCIYGFPLSPETPADDFYDDSLRNRSHFLQFFHPLTRRALASFACWALSSCRFKVIFKCRYAPESELKQERLCFVNRLRFCYHLTMPRRSLENWLNWSRGGLEWRWKRQQKQTRKVHNSHVVSRSSLEHESRLWTSAHATGFVEFSSSFKSCFVKIFDETRCECCRCSRSVLNTNHKFRNESECEVGLNGSQSEHTIERDIWIGETRWERAGICEIARRRL